MSPCRHAVVQRERPAAEDAATEGEVRCGQRGFSLIELLVSAFILGALAAIAAPTFLGQRECAWEAQAETELRNAVIQHEGSRVGDGGYLDVDPAAFVSSAKVTLDFATRSSVQYCLEALHARLPGRPVRHFNSASGAFGAGAC